MGSLVVPPLITNPRPSFAAPEDIAEAYDRYAATYDDLDGGAFAADTLGLDAMRRRGKVSLSPCTHTPATENLDSRTVLHAAVNTNAHVHIRMPK